MEKKKKGRGWSEKGTVEEARRGGGFSFIPSIPFFLGRFFWRAKNPKRKKGILEGMEAAGSWRGAERREPQSGSGSLRLFGGCPSSLFF